MKLILSCIASGAVLFVCAKTNDFKPGEIRFQEKEKVEWELVWEDNFETDGLPNENIWSYEVGYIRNNEAQYYTEKRAENARVENGNLVIEARKDNWNGNGITSASINTFNKKNVLYGRVEVRAKLPTGRGTWPAIWMLGTNIKTGTGWPACGEIDIMENVGFDPDVIHANVHTKAYNHVLGTNKGNKITVSKPYNDFHIYTIEWFENHIDFYVDDSLYFSFKNEQTGNDTWPFDKPHYLIINLAIGGGWGGQQGIDETIFPQKYYIDYVKVYKQKE
ncbi:MAG: glycoside hydrolase family 16 protein [Prolixibacteraceae bacterium]|nr:glycoside hydrolase family 16 protein [Prolixibacteraceae bacterium]